LNLNPAVLLQPLPSALDVGPELVVHYLEGLSTSPSSGFSFFRSNDKGLGVCLLELYPLLQDF